MRQVARLPRPFTLACVLAGVAASLFVGLLVTGAGGPTASRDLSDFGLVAATLAATAACASAARKGRHRRMWWLLSASCFSWGIGQMIWTAYEAIPPTREVPFPSAADIGYLGAVPLAVAALISLPTVSQSTAGRLRTLLDGMMIAGSLLLTSWVIVLKPVFHAGGDSLLAEAISLAYPAGDVVIATIVLYVLLRVRQTRAAGAVPLGLIGGGLGALAVSDSGFAYLTATNSYASGNLIDIGWFLGFTTIALAGVRGSKPAAEDDSVAAEGRPLPVLLPYVAVLVALAASSIEVIRVGGSDLVMTWIRTGIVLALVARQIVTLSENLSLTKHLNARLRDLRASEKRFEALVQHSSDVVTVVDADGVVEYQSESVQRVFGYSAESLVGRPITDVLVGQSIERLRETLEEAASESYATRVIECTLPHVTGRVCHAEMTITNLLENVNVGGFVLNTRDISERKTLQDQLIHEAFHDSLTDLANRALFSDRIEDILRRGFRDGNFTAVLFMDLDGFKSVNDSLGHAAGDLLLVQFAERLTECVRPTDLVARLGGDEFAVLIPDQTDYKTPVSIVKRIMRSLKRSFVIDGHEINLSASIGIATTEGAIDSSDQLLRNADLAMYRAKSTDGGSGYAIYDPKMHARLVERLQLEADLRRALDLEELVLHYQPTVALASGTITGFEALVRWQHPTRGLVPPDQFIGLAEETGLIRPLGRWVLDQACRELAGWRKAYGLPWLTMSVNISGYQLHHGSLVPDVSAALATSGLPAHCLVLEMTESVLMDHSEETLELLGSLKEMGVRLAIDDFGTGYSSLSYLHRFPVDILKIDRSFVERLGTSGGDSELVGTIVRLGQSLRMTTIAEGVEELEQVRLLRALGCEMAQGFHFSRPIVAEAVEDHLLAGMPQLPTAPVDVEPAAAKDAAA
jgi:diguanylate cyclase (GGDEF)-like protein/PAS domain S-box-containing protein